MSKYLKRLGANELSGLRKPPVDAETLSAAAKIVQDVRLHGEAAIRKYAEQFGERKPDEALILTVDELANAYHRLSESDQGLLQRVAKRIEAFATAQLGCLDTLDVAVPGGRAGHTIEPIQRVGCYAPGGRYPLPSTVLMTAVTARVAGCEHITLASPNPTDLTLAAAYVAGADAMMPIGGAHAIASLAFGVGDHPRCDLIAGPGNKWVTAAKQCVVGQVGIDMLAGPSELVIVADEASDAVTVAADLLAQAEHDSDARPFLVCIGDEIAENVESEIERQLSDLPTGETARQALGNGAAIVVDNSDEAVEVCNLLAPEHLELHVANASLLAPQLRHAGCLFIGSKSAEVLGDYGVGPNHTLPTGGTARWNAGLNVFSFLRVRTWLNVVEPESELVRDTIQLAYHEGLVAHARSAERRLPSGD